MKIIYYLATAFLLFGFSGCAPEHKKKYVKIVPLEMINSKMALSIDFVKVYSQDMFTKVQNMDAKTFNENKKELMLSYPTEIKVWNYAVINNQMPSEFEILHQGGFWGIIIFVHFLDNPSNKYIIPADETNTVLQISQGSFTIIKTKTVIEKKKKCSRSSCKTIKLGKKNDEKPFPNYVA